MEKSTDFSMERRLKIEDPDLHKRFTEMVFVMQHTLGGFQRLFPGYTDHSVFHSLNVLDFCNELIGPRQLEMMNKDEVYVLLMASYLHDCGMAISQKDYEEFKDELGAEEYFSTLPNATEPDFVRDRHNEFSGKFIEKYAEFLEIPSEEMVFAIKQVSRGHRRTNLFDEEEYPAALDMKDGLTVCTPYLAALIRLADEIDVVADRNPKLLYDLESLEGAESLVHFGMHEAIRRMDVLPQGFMLHVQTDDPKILAAMDIRVRKMQDTLDLCRNATALRTPFRITQEWVRMQMV